MQRTFRITVEGRSYTVVVEEITGPPPPGEVLPAWVASVPAAVPAGPAPEAVAPPTPGAEVAPLAGVVVAISVEPGQTIHPGQRIATIEAMKMKTDVLAKGAGVVTAIAVKVNDSVDTGQTLLTLG